MIALVLLLVSTASGGDYDDKADHAARAEALEQLRREGDLGALLRVVAKSSHMADRLEAMRLVTPHADRRTVERLFAIAGKKNNSMLAMFLEHCLPALRDAKARAWVLTHGLSIRDERLCTASVVAVRAWGIDGATPALLRLADDQLRRGAARSHVVLYEAARALTQLGGEA